MAAHTKDKFFEENPELREILGAEQNEIMTAFQKIDEQNDEFWLLQCPKGSVVKQLDNQKLKFPGRASLNDVEVTTLSTDDEAKQAFGYISRNGQHCLKLLPIAGNIVLRNRLHRTPQITAEIITESHQKSRVQLPELIKVRHPLLGANFDSHLKAGENASIRLRKAEDISMRIACEARLQKRNRKMTGMESNVLNSALPKVTNQQEEILVNRSKKRNSTLINAEDGPCPKKHFTKITENISEDLEWLKNI